MTTNNITDIYYENAKKQKEANAEATQILKDAKAAQIQEDNALLEKTATAAKDKARAQYNEIYDTNAVNQYISEQRVAESMANAGLTKSGLNATQMTAIQTSRGNADNRARLQEQAAIDDIELQLTEGIAQNQRSLREYEAQQDAQLKADNAAIDTQATKDAQQAVNDYNQSVTDAANTRDTEIKTVTEAAKTLNINKFDENGALGLIKRAADQYSLSPTEIATMCGAAGISYKAYADLYGDGEKKWAQNHIEIATGLFSKGEPNNYLFIKDVWNEADSDRDKRYIIEDFVTAKVFTPEEAEQALNYLPIIRPEAITDDPEEVLKTLMKATENGNLNNAPLAFLLCMAGLGA